MRRRAVKAGLGLGWTFLAIWLVFGPAMASDRAADLRVRLKAGDRLTIDIRLDEERRRGELLEAHTLHSVTYRGRVDEAIGQGYRITLLTEAHDFKVLADSTGAATVADAALRQILALFTGRSITVETDAAGRPLRIIGWKGLAQELAAAFRTAGKDALVNSMMARNAGLTREAAEQRVAGQLETVVDTMLLARDERSATELLVHLGMLAALQGLELPLGRPIELGEALHKQLTGSPVAGATVAQLVRHDPEAGVALVRFTSVFNEFALGRAVAAGDQSAPGRAGEVVVRGLRASRFDGGRAIIDIPTGLVRDLERSSETRVTRPGSPEALTTTRTTITVKIEDGRVVTVASVPATPAAARSLPAKQPSPSARRPLARPAAAVKPRTVRRSTARVERPTTPPAAPLQTGMPAWSPWAGR